MAMFFVVITPQIVVASIEGGGSRRWSWQLIPDGEEYFFHVLVKHQIVTSVEQIPCPSLSFRDIYMSGSWRSHV